VRSGARDSMPGMMDTILNLGINDEVTEVLAARTNNPKFAWDSYRRFLQMYGGVVMGVEKKAGEHHDPYEVILDKAKAKRGVKDDTGLTVEDMKGVVESFKKLIKKRTGKNFPQNPNDQLWGAVSAVFSSWNNDRAKVYRRKYGIPAEWGTAVNVQAMVFGNTGKDSSTGNISSMPRARTSWRACGPRRRWPRWPRTCPSHTPSFSRCAPSSKSILGTCRTSNSRSRAASSTSCRPGMASAPASRRSTSRLTWSTSA